MLFIHTRIIFIIIVITFFSMLHTITQPKITATAFLYILMVLPIPINKLIDMLDIIQKMIKKKKFL